MKIYYVEHNDGRITTANWPIKENGVESQVADIPEEDQKAVEEGVKDWVVTEGVLTTIESTRKADREALEVEQKAEAEAKQVELDSLKNKLSEGKASLSEIQLALSKLI